MHVLFKITLFPSIFVVNQCEGTLFKEYTPTLINHYIGVSYVSIGTMNIESLCFVCKICVLFKITLFSCVPYIL